MKNYEITYIEEKNKLKERKTIVMVANNLIELYKILEQSSIIHIVDINQKED